MTHRSILAALIATAATAGVADAAPDWCNDPDIRHIVAPNVDTAQEDNPLNAIPPLVATSCGHGSHANEHVRELEAARAKWNTRLDLTEADWTDVVDWATSEQWRRNSPSLANDPKVAISARGPVEQYASIKMASGSDDLLYLLDAYGDKLTEAGRLGYIERCLAAKRPAEWALCQPDIDALDAKKLSTQLRADTKRSGYERMVVRIAADMMRPTLAARAKEVEALLAKDPGYKTLFATAATARAGWAARVDAKLVELVLAMDDARVTRSAKAIAGCDERTWTAFSDAIRAIPASKFAELKDEDPLRFFYDAIRVVIADPNPYLAAVALHTCHADKPTFLTGSLGDALRYWPGFRGPRTTALTELTRTQIALDDRDAKIELPRLEREWFKSGPSSGGGGIGPVTKVKASGDTTTIEFVKKPAKEKVCADWKDTNQVVQVTSSGSVIYGYKCLRYETIKIDHGTPPQEVKTRFAAKAKAGNYVAVVTDLVAAVWPKRGKPPIAVLGVPLQ